MKERALTDFKLRPARLEDHDILRALISRCELMATLPGLKLYRALGYVPGTPIRHPLGEGLDIEFVPMSKTMA